VGARVDWLLPEIFYSPGIDVARDWGLISQKTDPHFLEEIRGMSDFHPPVTVPDLDRLTSTVAKNLLDEESPDLTLIHLVGADYAQHLSGIDSPQTHAAVREIDRQVAEIVHAADLSRRVVMITGDHGFKNYRKALAINALLADKGWLKASHGAIESWSAVAQPDGGGAAIYAKTPELGEQVRTLLLQEAKGRFRIIDHPQLSALHSFPDAAFAVVAEEGYIFSDDLTGAFEKELPGTKGHHGYLPNDPKMQTGLIVAGMGIRPGLDLGYVRVLDVAPTVADLIGIPGEIPGAEGRPLPIRALSERAPTPKVPGKLLDNVD
jgi:predicted AlkP superfamily pyrophosphatase or phosphodiesterase